MLRIGVLLACLFSASQLSAQERSTKFGRVTNDEVKMTTYEADTTASAVVLYKEGTTYYEWVNNDFRVIYDIFVKIKVLKPEGTEYADVSIPYFQSEQNSLTKELVTGLDANVYNLVNDKVERIKMKKEYVFKERVSDRYMQLKFSIPSVKAGSVIEYKYRL